MGIEEEEGEEFFIRWLEKSMQHGVKLRYYFVGVYSVYAPVLTV